MGTILTMRQYAAGERRRMVEEYGVGVGEVAALYPNRSFQSRWYTYALERFEAGDDFTPQAIAGLSSPMLRDLSRTTRGLREGLPAVYTYAMNRRHAA
jgi:hypothetical protein